jgi:serine/threonine protein kinase
VLQIHLVDSSHIEDFRQEAETLKKLDHPHIVGLIKYGRIGTSPFLVMKYAPNGTLRDAHPRGEPVPTKDIVNYVKQIADALDYLHSIKDKEKPLMHLDLKPENVLLGANREVLLSDFGLAQTVQNTTSRITQELKAGTPTYMAPEHRGGRPCKLSTPTYF